LLRFGASSFRHIARIHCFVTPCLGWYVATPNVLFWRPCTPTNPHRPIAILSVLHVGSSSSCLRAFSCVTPLFWLVRCDACVFVLQLPVVWRGPPNLPQHHTVDKRNGNPVLRVLSLWVDSVRRTVRALPVERSIWLFAIVDILN
jgi:hypothetical protein